MISLSKKCFILLNGGKASGELSSIFGEIPSGLLPINGKPVIMHTIRNILDNSSYPVYLVVGYKKELIYDKILRYLSDKEKNRIKILETNPEYRPGYSFALGFQKAKFDGIRDAMLVLADTLIDKKIIELINKKKSFIGVSYSFIDPSRWAILINTKPLSIVDKSLYLRHKKYLALVGIYYLTQIQNWSFRLKNVEISKYLEEYAKTREVVPLEINNWIDVGHIDNYYRAKKRFMSSRYFNKIINDEFTNVVTKFSQNKEKLINEINWFLKIPNELKFVCPQIYDFDLTKPYLKMEFIPYPKMDELFLYSDLHEMVWFNILNRFINTLKLFNRYNLHIDEEDYYFMYVDKLKKRLNEARAQNAKLKKLLDSEAPKVNNTTCFSVKEILHLIEDNLSSLYKKTDNSIIHGDFCFSNIFYSPESDSMKLIDPRGKWGKSGIGGDIKYDYAKLSHSISGGYDSIINDYFEINMNSSHINLSLFKPSNSTYLEKLFFELIPYKREVIELIESTLFLSMVPLHKDNLYRQLAMLSIGLVKATESLQNIK
ncbi:MAG: hypothetical protein QW625_02675 [Candidatus Nanoarchaeia archaeon]